MQLRQLRQLRNCIRKAIRTPAVLAPAFLIIAAQPTWAADDAQINLSPEDQLIGKKIMSSDGEQAGEIKYLMIDGSRAKVRYVLIAEDGALDLEDDELIAVPFSELNITQVEDAEIRVDESLESLRGATRITEDAISDLTDPVLITAVYDYFLTPDEDRLEWQSDGNQNQTSATNRNSSQSSSSAAQRSSQNDQLSTTNRAQTGQQSADNRSSADNSSQQRAQDDRSAIDNTSAQRSQDDPQTAVTPSNQQSTLDDRSAAGNTSQQRSQDEPRTAATGANQQSSQDDRLTAGNTSQQRSQDTPQTAASRGNPQSAQDDNSATGNTGQQRNQDNQQTASYQQGRQSNQSYQLLAARDVVSTVIPGMRTAGDFLGADVKDVDDEDVGEIKHLMLDLDDGRVAYALVGKGGVLGFGESWHALPLESLQWNAEEEAYMTTMDVDQLLYPENLPLSDSNATVSKSDLDELYQSFGLSFDRETSPI